MNKLVAIKNNALLFALLFILWLSYVFIEFRFVAWIKDEGYVRMHPGSTTLSTLEIFLLTIFIYPLVEEVIFRLPLRLERANVIISLLVATWYYSFQNELLSLQGNTFGYKQIIPLLITVLLILFFFKTRYVEKLLAILKDHYYLPSVLISAVIFAMAHFWKLGYDSLFYAFLFILVVYFILGLFLSYVRIKLNFWAALFFHILHNSVPYVILLYYSIKQGQNLFLYI